MSPVLVEPTSRRAFSLVLNPIPSHKALKEASSALFNERQAARDRDKVGREDTIVQATERSEAHERLAAVNDGHASLRFAGLLCVTAPTKEELAVATEEVKAAALRAGCEVRVATAEQGGLFAAAALPLAWGLK